MKKALPWILGALGLWWFLKQTQAGQSVLNLGSGLSGSGGGNSSSNTTNNGPSAPSQNPLGNLLGGGGLGNLGSALSAAIGELFGNASDAISGKWTPTGSTPSLSPGIPYTSPDETVDSIDVPPAIVGASPAANAGTNPGSVSAAQMSGADLAPDLSVYESGTENFGGGGGGGTEDFGGDDFSGDDFED